MSALQKSAMLRISRLALPGSSRAQGFEAAEQMCKNLLPGCAAGLSFCRFNPFGMPRGAFWTSTIRCRGCRAVVAAPNWGWREDSRGHVRPEKQSP